MVIMYIINLPNQIINRIKIINKIIVIKTIVDKIVTVACFTSSYFPSTIILHQRGTMMLALLLLSFIL